MPPVGGDNGSTFDVVVFYTPAARAVAGGDTAVRARIALGVSETNTAYANSSVVPRLRLVGAELVSYTESGNLGADLNAIRDPSDGVADSVHARRNQLGADLAMLVVGAVAGGACGIGYVMTSLSPAFGPFAFTIAAYPCISPNYTFGHELGHNMGSAHAPEDGAGQASLYPYSFGYKHPGHLFRTVMAYNCPSDCPRVLHFSNPTVSYSGATTGTAAQHDNARSINNAASTVANWRQTVGGGVAPTITPVADVTIDEDTATGPLAFTVGDADTALAGLTVTAASANTALVPNTPAALALGGAGANRTLVATPSAHQFGTAAITLTVSDGAHSASRTFTLTVKSVNDAPTIGVAAAHTTPEDTPLAVPFTIADIDTPTNSLVVHATSSNTTLAPASGLALGGSSGSCTLTVSPAPDQYGSTTITLTVSDGIATTSAAFVVTVAAVNDPPAFAAGVPVAVSTVTGTATSFPVTVTDVDTPGAGLTLTGTSTDPALLPDGGIGIASTASTGSSRTFSVTLTPTGGMTGIAAVALTARDAAGGVTQMVNLSVVPAPTAPDPPSILNASVTGLALQLTWMAATTGTPATSYAVSVGDAPGVTTLPVQHTSATTASVPLTAAGTYYARVRAVNAFGTSAPSAEVSAVLTIVDPRPGKPEKFGASLSGRSVRITWAAPTTGDPVTAYVLEGGSAPGLADFGTANVGGATSFSAGGVPDGTFWLRLRAVNGAGTGPPSADLALVMRSGGGCVGLPLAPILWAATVAGNHVALAWTPAAEGTTPASYVLVAGSSPTLTNVAVINLGSAASSVSGAVPDGTYFLRVAGRSGCGVGPLSNEVPLRVGASVR